MRTFIALDLPIEARPFLTDIQRKLKKADADIKWIKPEQIHLTLKFLGEIDPAQAGALPPILDTIAQELPAFAVRLKGIGAFPPTGQARILWVGIECGLQEVTALAQRIEATTAAAGFPPEDRPFKPHITIGRVKTGRNKNQLKTLIDDLGQVEMGTGNYAIRQVVFYKSTLTPQGPQYEVLHAANLKTS